MNALKTELSLLESLLPNYSTKNPVISASTVGWHMQHSLLTINAIIAALQKSQPVHFKKRFSFARFIVLSFKTIPRGRAKAPSIVVPQKIDEATLVSCLQETTINLAMLDQLPVNSYFTHPYFGDLKLKQAILFLSIHTRHHLKIINDIIHS